jgi:hypothetical protein
VFLDRVGDMLQRFLIYLILSLERFPFDILNQRLFGWHRLIVSCVRKLLRWSKIADIRHDCDFADFHLIRSIEAELLSDFQFHGEEKLFHPLEAENQAIGSDVST